MIFIATDDLVVYNLCTYQNFMFKTQTIDNLRKYNSLAQVIYDPNIRRVELWNTHTRPLHTNPVHLLMCPTPRILIGLCCLLVMILNS